MLATTTLTFALLIASVNENNGQITALTNIDGFGSPEACQLGIEVAKTTLPGHVIAHTHMLCIPVDAARPIPNALRQLIQPQEGAE